ncbi:MAG: SufD family Fe-S cluster assembly protein [Candidatus Omnitrophica bacterium]|nr:SufD family Fe-S cluster assembly protein [Candidatus Omnitrophota bacterium]
MSTPKPNVQINEDYEKLYGFHVPEHAVFKAEPGLDEGKVRQLSGMKGEPAWMLDLRLRGFHHYRRKPMPQWANTELLNSIKFDDIYYYLKPTEKKSESWEEVPAEIKETFDRLGIPEAERKFLAGVSAQFESEAIYHSMREDLQKQGVIFLDMDTGLKEQPELVKRYFGTVIPPADNKFAALNTATWSGGSFIYVPKGVKVEMPLQAYFRINAKNMGQFERTLIIADEGAEVTYIEGCFTKGALVTTNPDYKPIEQIKVGERVLTHAGQYRHVYRTQERPYSGPLYTVEMYGDSTQRLEVTAEHPFLYVKRERANERNRHWDVQWGTPKDLKWRDYLAVPVNRITESVSSTKVTVPFRRQSETVELPSTAGFFRLVGYFLAEGSTDPRGYIHFAFGETERELIEDVKSLLRQTLGVTKADEFPHPKNHGINLVVSSAKLARAFRQLFGESAGTRRIPQWMMLETPEKQRELIVGVFRGDGNYYNQRNKHGRKEIFRITTVSPVLARQVRDVLLRLGVVACLNRRDRRHEHRQAMYTIGVGGEFASRFGELVGIQVRSSLNGKKRAAMFAIDERYAYVPIKRITKRLVKNTPVYNFSVEGDESYVAGGVAVHNCTAPSYSSDSLHSAVVELIALPHAKLRYVTIQNWSKNVYNLVTKRAIAHEGATVEWLDCNMGSRLTMKFPGVYLMGRGARGEVLSVAFASDGQHQDAGAKMIHAAPDTSSVITSKSISKGTGRTSYRGLVKVYPGAVNAKSTVRCDALLLNPESRSDTYPTMEIDEKRVQIGHEATVSKIGDEQLFYAMSRGLKEQEAMSMIVNGFIEPFVKALPLEYAVEMNRLVQLEMEGAVG